MAHSVPLPQIPPDHALAVNIPARLPDIASLPSLDDATLAGTLDLLFEPSPDLHSLAAPAARSITFSGYPELVETIRATLLSVQSTVHPDPVARAPLLRILAAHPRLGEKKPLSAQSRAEQASLQAAADPGAAQAAKLAALNAEYEARFPGLRYVVFVNGRSRDVIMENMRARIDRGDVDAEEKEAINAMCDIAKDRAEKLRLAAK